MTLPAFRNFSSLGEHGDGHLEEHRAAETGRLLDLWLHERSFLLLHLLLLAAVARIFLRLSVSFFSLFVVACMP